MSEHQDFDKALTGDLQHRLNSIILEIPYFWDRGPHRHFTLQGVSHSERVHRQKLAQLAQELPEHERLTQDEIFIVSAAAWLYEIGMQCTDLRPTLDMDYQHGIALSPAQLQQIREQKHLLSHRMIRDSLRHDYQGSRPRLGLIRADDYTELIAEVCRWCSSEPIEQVPEKLPVNGLMVRVRLLVALLRLADQLYIDNSRVNLDLLLAAQLPPRQEARWWAYHYTQTLPIDKGLFKFHYFLPNLHRPLLDHIRALIEPDFDRETNLVIRYLLNMHHLTVLPNEPSVRFDQPAGFQREMPSEMVSYVRRLTPLPSNSFIADSSIMGGKSAERNLLVLDFENFLLQLGLEGHFLSIEESKRLLVTLHKEAREQFDTMVNGLAAGHWHRPDLQPIAETLQRMNYTLIPVNEHVNPSETLLQELQNRLHSARLPKNVLLVAPSQELAPIIGQCDEQSYIISTWAANIDDTYIFQALVHQFTSLKQVLKLPVPTNAECVLMQEIQSSCILSLDKHLAEIPAGLSFAEVATSIQQVTQGHADWWRLWLLYKDILSVSHTPNGYRLHLNTSHTLVDTVYKKRAALILALAPFAQDLQGLSQRQLIQALLRQTIFQGQEEQITSFLSLLRDADIVAIDTRSSTLDNEPFWQLNTRNRAVATLTAHSYLPFLILGLDHTMVQTGLPVIHEHTLKGRLRNYIEPSTLDTIYQLARAEKWVQSFEMHSPSREQVIGVEPIQTHPEVQHVLLNRDILLDVLYRKAARNTIQRDTLWFELNKIRRFTLKRKELNQWLTVFQRDALISIKKDATDTEHDAIQLRTELPLAQLLLGRINIYGVILAMRILRANAPDNAKLVQDVIEGLSRRTTRGNRDLAGWAVAYARKIKLLSYTRPPTVSGEFLYLNKHRIVQNLDSRELNACKTVFEIVKRLSRNTADGWVSKPLLMQEMAYDTQLGYTHSEFEYWLNQTIYRHKKLNIRTEPGYPPKDYIRLALQEQH